MLVTGDSSRPTDKPGSDKSTSSSSNSSTIIIIAVVAACVIILVIVAAVLIARRMRKTDRANYASGHLNFTNPTYNGADSSRTDDVAYEQPVSGASAFATDGVLYDRALTPAYATMKSVGKRDPFYTEANTYASGTGYMDVAGGDQPVVPGAMGDEHEA